ncbi:Protein CBG14630 [Caenorhabditis briggsae]|uniref:Protein CBG14630 n=1 Tax=Caenorhabditis briggsae TaxID=6238 RepID=A8XKB7_CAEBR|nr:Protein CBG14630 [Caenorhabditis briggsae]CAP33091.2 Protein CBG14630 [Caenorhabditis briggsae]
MSLSQTIKAIAMTTANVSIVSDSLPKITGAIPDEIWMIVALVVGIILIVSETCCEIFYAVRIFQMIYKYVISNQKNLLHFYFLISIGLMGSSNLTYLVLDMMALQLPAANVRFLATEIIKIAHFVTEYYSIFFTYLFCLLRFLLYAFPGNPLKVNTWILFIYFFLTIPLSWIPFFFLESELGYYVWDLEQIYDSFVDRSYNYGDRIVIFVLFIVSFLVLSTNLVYALYANKRKNSRYCL